MKAENLLIVTDYSVLSKGYSTRSSPFLAVKKVDAVGRKENSDGFN